MHSDNQIRIVQIGGIWRSREYELRVSKGRYNVLHAGVFYVFVGKGERIEKVARSHGRRVGGGIVVGGTGATTRTTFGRIGIGRGGVFTTAGEEKGKKQGEKIL